MHQLRTNYGLFTDHGLLKMWILPSKQRLFRELLESKGRNQLEINRKGELPKSDVKEVNANHGWRNTPRRWSKINAGFIVTIPDYTSIRLLDTSDTQLLHRST